MYHELSRQTAHILYQIVQCRVFRHHNEMDLHRVRNTMGTSHHEYRVSIRGLCMCRTCQLLNACS